MFETRVQVTEMMTMEKHYSISVGFDNNNFGSNKYASLKRSAAPAVP